MSLHVQRFITSRATASMRACPVVRQNFTCVLLHDSVSFSLLTASLSSRLAPSLPPGQPVPTWSWGSVCLSASPVLRWSSSSSSSGAPWLSLSLRSAHPGSANASGLSRTASHQPVPFLLSSLSPSFLSIRILLFFFFPTFVLRGIVPARRSRISRIIYAASSTEWSLRYSAWPRADSRLSENRSAWFWSFSSHTLSFTISFWNWGISQ